MPTVRVVVDPSVVIKWYVPEDDASFAEELKQWLLSGPHRLIVPLLFFDEMANILWKKEVLRKEILPRAAKEILGEVLRLPVQVILDREEMLPKALEIARESRISVYDAIYVSAAIQNQAIFITADEQLVRKLAAFPFASSVLLLSDWATLSES